MKMIARVQGSLKAGIVALLMLGASSLSAVASANEPTLAQLVASETSRSGVDELYDGCWSWCQDAYVSCVNSCGDAGQPCWDRCARSQDSCRLNCDDEVQ